MTVYSDTGHGASVTFSGGFTAVIRKISAVEQDGEKVEDSSLANTLFKSYLAGDLIEPGEFELDVVFSTGQALPVPYANQTVTITAPTQTGQASAANLAGTGFIMGRTGMPEMATNGLQMGKVKVAFDGKTGPTFTAAVDT